MSGDTEEIPLTLKDACRILFRNAIKPASLRAEARRGRLNIFRIGRTDFVLPSAVRELMVPECPENENHPVSTSAPTNRSGSSETDRKQSARVAALATAQALKKRSPPISGKSSSPSPGKVVQLSSRSMKS